jgi:hypothetical protein
MIIVSGPYSHKDPAVKELRIKTIAKACVKLMADGKTHLATSPLLYGLSLISHTQEGDVKLPDSYEFWEKFCLAFVEVGTELYVLNLDGWEESGGTKGEIIKAKELKIPVYLVDSKTLEYIKVL